MFKQLQNLDNKSLAIAAEVLYLLNLLLFPGLAFVVLALLYLSTRAAIQPLALNHLSQTVGVSVLGGSLLVVVLGLVFLFGNFDSPYIWVGIVFYFTFVHSALIFMGIFGLIKALNEEHFVFPILGRMFRA